MSYSLRYISDLRRGFHKHGSYTYIHKHVRMYTRATSSVALCDAYNMRMRNSPREFWKDKRAKQLFSSSPTAESTLEGRIWVYTYTTYIIIWYKLAVFRQKFRNLRYAVHMRSVQADSNAVKACRIRLTYWTKNIIINHESNENQKLNRRHFQRKKTKKMAIFKFRNNYKIKS